MSEPTWIAIAALAALQLVVALLVLLRGGGRDASILHGKIAAIEANVAVISQGVSRMNQSLTEPGRRGSIGEHVLKDLLANVFHGRHRLQYAFKDGTAVDAVLEIRDQLLPIDSKFPLANYKRWLDATDEKEKRDSEKAFIRDIKGRIEETKKYIKTGERTFPFAFMFIPAESIYYSMLTGEIGCDQQQRTLIQQATAENVFIVSPATLYVYLHMVMEGLTGLEIEGGVRQIVSRIKELNPQLETFGGSYKRIGEALRGLAKAYESGGEQLQTFEQTLRRATSSGELGQ